MKKTFIILLVAAMLFASACTSTPAPQSGEPSQSNAAATPAPETANQEQPAQANATPAIDSQVTTTQEAIAFELPIQGVGTKVSTGIKADKPYKIAIIVKNTANPYMVKAGDGLKKAGEDMGFEALFFAPTQADSVEEQVSIMETLMQQNVDAFILIPVDSNGIMPGVNKAKEKNIPIAAIGTAPSKEIFLRTGYDYIDAGYTLAKTLIEAAGSKGGAIVLEGPAGAQNAQECLQGINTALAEYPDVTVLASQTANYRRTEGMQVMENLVQKHKNELNIVIAANDEMAIGAIQALKAAGVNANVYSGGPGATKDACQAIKDGDMYASYNTDPYGGAYLAAAYLVDYLNTGKTPPQYFIPFPSKESEPIITKENVNYFEDNIAWWAE